MIVTIPQDEKPGFEKVCAIFGIEVKFFTQENNSEMVTMELTDDISKETLFHLVRSADTQNDILRFIKA
jgi:hypothetical protein